MDLFTFPKRKIKNVVKIGNVSIGGLNKIAIQSMTNTKTKDVFATVNQIIGLSLEGCDIVRVAVLDMTDALSIKSIKEELKKRNIDIPIVADIHFDYKLALASIESGADKIRINPGNIGSIDRIKAVVDKCKEKSIPIRIGVNSGSLDEEIIKKYGNSPRALVESCRKHIEILESLDFKDIVISLKASDVKAAIEAYNLASNSFPYPIHIGITEAGTIFKGSIYSSVGEGIMLYSGIGDTLRVSLTGDPIEEVRVAKEILASLGLLEKATLISCPTCGRTQYDMIPIANEIERFLGTLKNTNIKVAIMGCVVNGPGEAKEADIGIAGGKNEALLFKKGEVIRKIKQEDIVEELEKEILAMLK